MRLPRKRQKKKSFRPKGVCIFRSRLQTAMRSFTFIVVTRFILLLRQPWKIIQMKGKLEGRHTFFKGVLQGKNGHYSRHAVSLLSSHTQAHADTCEPACMDMRTQTRVDTHTHTHVLLHSLGIAMKSLPSVSFSWKFSGPNSSSLFECAEGRHHMTKKVHQVRKNRLDSAMTKRLFKTVCSETSFGEVQAWGCESLIFTKNTEDPFAHLTAEISFTQKTIAGLLRNKENRATTNVAMVTRGGTAMASLKFETLKEKSKKKLQLQWEVHFMITQCEGGLRFRTATLWQIKSFVNSGNRLEMRE